MIVPPRRPVADGLKTLLALLLMAHVFFPLIWLLLLWQHGPRGNDWLQFHITATQFVSGDWTDLYTLRLDSAHPGYFWRYPPYVLLLIAPLAWTTPAAAYAVLASSAVAALAASLAVLSRVRPIRDPVLWGLAIALSAPALTTTITGQLSALLLLCVVIATALWDSGRVTAAGIVLGLMAVKPNLGIFFGLYAIATAQWRGAAAMLGVAAALCLATLPLGSDLWIDFIAVSRANVDSTASYYAYKLVTLKGFLNVVVGPDRIAGLFWAALAIGLIGGSVWSWRRAPAQPVRQLAEAMLLAIAVSPYGFFYDALLLAFPATVWWWERDRWDRRRWLAVGVLIAVVWCWEHAAHTWVELLAQAGWSYRLPFSLVGPAAAVWLVLSLIEGRRRFAINRA